MSAELIAAFNSLPRSQRLGGDVPNNWVFTVRHVPVKPEADLIMLVNPATQESHCEGPIDLSAFTAVESNGVVIHCILNAFVSGMGSNDTKRKVAPWTWKTTDAKLAGEISDLLAKLDVREELRSVGVVDQETGKVVDVQWEDLLGTIQRSMAE